MITFEHNIEYLLAFIPAILGLSLPVLLQVIERLDQKYCTSRIADRLKKEKSISVCKWALVVALLTCIYAVFIKIPSPCDCWLLNNSADLLALISCIVLIVSFLRSCVVLMNYYNQGKLQSEIIKEINKTKDNLPKHENAFRDFVDLSKSNLDASERTQAIRVFDVVREEINGIIQQAEHNGMKIPGYLAFGITSINENLCLMERRPFSVNNGNQIVKILISAPTKLSEETYSLLWHNLILQLYYGADEWVYEYWATAVQTYDFDLRRIFVGIYGGDEEYTEDDVNIRLVQRQRFLEFHILLCAYILHQKKFELLGKLFWYTREMPPRYPLVPSSLTEIISIFEQIEDSPRLFLTAEHYYPFPGMKGIVDEEIKAIVKSYLSLLYLRLFSPIGVLPDVSIILPENLGVLKSYNSYLEYIKRRIAVIRNNTELYALVKTDSGDADKVIELILDDIRRKIDSVRTMGDLDDEIKKENLIELHELVINNLSPYNEIIKKKTNLTPDVGFWINGSVSYSYDNAAFMKNSDMSYVGMAESLGGSAIGKFQYYFASVFYQISKGFKYRINSKSVFEAIDKLQINDDFVIIAFDVYLDYYFTLKQNGLNKDNNGRYSYNGIEIVNLPSGSFQLMSRSIFILRKNDLPQVMFVSPADEQKDLYHLECIDKKIQLYTSIVQLSQDKDLLGVIKKDLPDEKLEDKSIFSAFLLAKVLWSKFIPIVGIKIMYDLRDNGTSDEVEKVASFDSLLKDKQTLFARAEELSAYHIGQELSIKLLKSSKAFDLEGVKDGKKVYIETKYYTQYSKNYIEAIDNKYRLLQDKGEEFLLYTVFVSEKPTSDNTKIRLRKGIESISNNIEVRFYSFVKS